ncbi:hypothetical protein [Desulfitobacterium sp. PCE1]|uniref:hypothetical protein n=1 Tax=Desulfitobacterium sp. PCE1 TaxID=146907 RepID=UPI00037D2D72|nr:hypothetical protein [Desulfitobacterium sp. PCE1]
MRFTWDQGNGSYGQTDPRVPRRLDTYQGMPMGGMPGQSSGWGRGVSPTTTAGGGYNYGAAPSGMTPGGIAPRGMPSAGMPGGIPPMGMPSAGMQGIGPMGPAPGGSIRNNLGAGLKQRGFFQKDGQINNLRGGFFGAKPYKPVTQSQGGGNMAGPFAFLGSGNGAGASGQHRQLVLEAAQAGMNANGIASISSDNVFSCIANLPSPNDLVGRGGTYAAYLVDNKGQTGFLAGVLRPVGNGVYQAQFRSQVPLHHYSRVIITAENSQQLGHVPQGPIVLQVRQAPGPVRFLAPIKKAGGSVWNKVTGLVQRRSAAPGIVEGGISQGEMTSSGAEFSAGIPEAIGGGSPLGDSIIEPLQ